MSLALTIGVKRSPAQPIDHEAQFRANEGWARGVAAKIVNERGTSWPLSQREDWQSDLVVHLWRVSASYDPARGSWRSWAYTVLLNQFTKVVTQATAAEKMLARGPMAEAASDDDCSVAALSETNMARVRQELYKMAQEDAKKAERLDQAVMTYLCEAGREHGALAHLELKLAIDRRGVLRCISRIRQAMIRAGVVEDEQEEASDEQPVG